MINTLVQGAPVSAEPSAARWLFRLLAQLRCGKMTLRCPDGRSLVGGDQGRPHWCHCVFEFGRAVRWRAQGGRLGHVDPGGAFADTGIPALFQEAYKLGLDKKRAEAVYGCLDKHTPEQCAQAHQQFDGDLGLLLDQALQPLARQTRRLNGRHGHAVG